MRRIASKLYTDDMKSPFEDIVRRHRLEIAAHFCPEAVISHRSAIEGGISPAGKLHLTSTTATIFRRPLPGLEIRIWRGPAAQPDDIRTGFTKDEPLFTASQARALLENMQIARAHGGDEPKTLSQEELERWIDKQIRALGGDWLDQTLTQTADVAKRLGWQQQQEKFAALVAAFKNQPTAVHLTSNVAQARAIGTPFDPERVTLFGLLHARLAAERFRELPRPPATEFENRAFWESYFSNFIEGTRFTVEEAQAIVFNPTVAKDLKLKRPEDAHDILETYRLIADPHISAEIPKSPADLIDLIKRRHARMMASRIDAKPGVFKKKNNQFGSRVFVRWEMVEETLRRGFPPVQTLPSAAARALYMLFLVAEVHPFIDGNGRISRLAMNAEFEAGGQARLIIPTAYRTDYVGVLEALTSRGDPEAFVAFGHKLIDINGRMPFGKFDESYDFFRKTGGLEDAPITFNFFPVSP